MRWLVVFKSHTEPPADTTFADVTAPSMLAAIRMAQTECPPPHPWCIVSAWPWPKGCEGAEEAAEMLTRRSAARRKKSAS